MDYDDSDSSSFDDNDVSDSDNEVSTNKSYYDKDTNIDNMTRTKVICLNFKALNIALKKFYTDMPDHNLIKMKKNKHVLTLKTDFNILKDDVEYTFADHIINFIIMLELYTEYSLTRKYDLKFRLILKKPVYVSDDLIYYRNGLYEKLLTHILQIIRFDRITITIPEKNSQAYEMIQHISNRINQTQTMLSIFKVIRNEKRRRTIAKKNEN